MSFSELQHKLQSIGQQDLLQEWNSLTPEKQETLQKQILELDTNQFQEQQSLLSQTAKEDFKDLEPFEEFEHSGNKDDKSIGKKLIADGQVGCILMAGGQGTRLRIEGPKGVFPVSVIKHKSLFQLVAEKVIAAGKQAGKVLPLAIMTSPLNHDATVHFFKEHRFFGLDPDQISFFTQGMLPFLTQEGNLLLEKPWKIAEGPDGNGSSLSHFVNDGIWKKWHSQGVRYVNYILIDNALADPFDAELVGFHKRQSADVTVKCTARRHASEKVGLLVKQSGKTRVMEYSELPEQERSAVNIDGSLKHACANLSLFCFSMDFVKTLQNFHLPLHKALKTFNGSDKHFVWKFERFIFDVLPSANKVSALLYPREECFSPLKNYDGEDSLKEVKLALQMQSRRIFSEITGLPSPNTPFELDTQFLYPTPELLAKWKNALFPGGSYIEP